MKPHDSPLKGLKKKKRQTNVVRPRKEEREREHHC